MTRLDLATGARRTWLETRPPDETAVGGAVGMEVTLHEPGELFVVEGLR